MYVACTPALPVYPFRFGIGGAVFFRKPHYWLIFDELEGTGLHHVASYLHIAPSTLEAQGDRVVATLTASGRQVTAILAGAPLHPALDTTS
ncbi:hypothetical protein C2W62_08095 [Candidatus Entotheonella serta]|nr:hypothetical protein C2W62_08095 [Candidatus Entotheonella serta]